MRPAQGRHSEKGGAVERDRPGRLVKVGVPLVAGEGHGLVLLDGRLVGVDELAAAADEEHGSAALGAELPDLQRGGAPLLPALVADGVEVTQDLGQGELQQLRQLPGHAERSPLASKALGRISEPLYSW